MIYSAQMLSESIVHMEKIDGRKDKNIEECD